MNTGTVEAVRVADERPEIVADWMARVEGWKDSGMWRLYEFDLLDWILTLEATVDAQRALLRGLLAEERE